MAVCLCAGARAAAGRRQPQDRAEGSGPVPPGGRREGRACRRGSPGGPQRDRRVGAPDPAHPGTAGPPYGDDAQRRRDPGRDGRERRAGAGVGRDRRARGHSCAGGAGREGPVFARAGRGRYPADDLRPIHPAADGANPGDRGPVRAGQGDRPHPGPGADRGFHGRRERRQFHRGAGCPLAGRGAGGGGAHADDEHIVIDSLAERAALLAALLRGLEVEC